MAVVALTNFKIGSGADMKWIDEGDDVKASDFPDKETYDDLKEQGLIGAPPKPREEDASSAELEAENDDLKARVAKLEAELAEAKKTTPAKTTTTPTK